MEVTRREGPVFMEITQQPGRTPHCEDNKCLRLTIVGVDEDHTLRILRASLWLTPLVLLPLMDKTRSPFWIRPSRSARLPAITLCTCNITWVTSIEMHQRLTGYHREGKKEWLQF